MQARALLLAALAALALAREPPAASCPARCDVSRCPSPRCPGGYVPDLCNCCLVCAATEGEPCGRPVDSPCGESLECVRGLCRCRWAHAVCGTDGHTYANVCALQAASRRALQLSGTPVRQLQKGACPSDQFFTAEPLEKPNLRSRLAKPLLCVSCWLWAGNKAPAMRQSLAVSWRNSDSRVQPLWDWSRSRAPTGAISLGESVPYSCAPDVLTEAGKGQVIGLRQGGGPLRSGDESVLPVRGGTSAAVP
ncbi:hypothetical protein FD754_021421, partial [Muntiacus muntjak]